MFSAFVFFGLVLSALIGIGSSSGTGIEVFIAFIGFGIAAFVFWRILAHALSKRQCAGARPAVEHRGWSGTVSSFAFTSTKYAVRYANGNAKHLINVSMKLRRILEEYASRPRVELVKERGTPSAAVRITPAVAIARATSRDLALEWISRIEGYKGSEARRSALRRGLEQIREPSARLELMLGASRIEVAATLDKIDGLSSSAAKRRHLQKAIANLHADEIPDELKAAQLQQLEARLRELG